MSSLERTLATRFLLSRRRSRAVSVASLTAVLGMAFGIGALLVTLSVISGFQHAYKQAILGFNSHLVLLKAEESEGLQPIVDRLYEKSRALGPTLGPVVGWTPFLYREGMMISHGKVKGIVVKGVDFEKVRELAKVKMEEAETPGRRLPKLYLGKDLLDQFQEGEVQVLFPPQSLVRFQVAGHFQSGLYEYDSSFAFMGLEEAQKIFGRSVSGIEVWLRNPDRAEEWARELQNEFHYPYLVMSWRELNENIFRALEMEKVVFFVLMAVLIVIASLNILGTLVMLLLERRGEIAVLRALGMPWARLRRVFLWEGLLIGFLGTALGVILGLAVLFCIEHGHPIPLAPEIYFVKSVPVFYSWRNFFWVTASGMLIVFAGCEFTLQAVRRIPVLRTLVEG